MDISKLKEKLMSMMETYFVSYKLREEDARFGIDEHDNSVYDSWDWNSPSCYSVVISNFHTGCIIKGSINIEDGECILDIHNTENLIAGKFLVERYQELKPLKLMRCGWAYHNDNWNEHKCLIYFEHEDIFFDLLEEYLKII